MQSILRNMTWCKFVSISLFVLVGLPGLLLAALLLLESLDPISQANYEKIRLGMKKDEVEKILGGPPGSYETKPLLSVTEGLSRPGKVAWLGDNGRIDVQFSDSGAVIDKSFFDYRRHLGMPSRPGEQITAFFFSLIRSVQLES